MPDIVVKKADGVTDVTYKLLAPSAGDSSSAVYSQVVGFAIPALRPGFDIKSSSNGTGGARRIVGAFFWPISQEDAGGNVKVIGKASVTITALLPQNIEQSTIDEVAAQASNLVDSDVFVGAMKSGYAPRN